MQDHTNDSASHVGQLDHRTVERLTSEVTALKLELATLISAVNELQIQQIGRRLPAFRRPVPPAPKPSGAPAAVIVMIAVGLLSWQLIVSARPEGRTTPRSEAAAQNRSRERQPAPQVIPAIARTPAGVPPEPAFYRGTLAVAADQPQAEVFVNRKRVGSAPVRVRNLRAGSHLVWIESEGHRRWTRVVTVPAERVTRVRADLEPVDRVDEH